MYCPKCKSEYRDGFTTCADCQIKLVAQLTELLEISEAQPTEPFDANLEGCSPVKLSSFSNEVDVQLVLNLLKNNNIPCFRKSKEAGGYMNIYTGFSVFGEDIYVAEKDYIPALDLLSVMQSGEEQKNIDDNEINYHVPFYRNRSFYVNLLRFGLISYIAITIIFIIIANILSR